MMKLAARSSETWRVGLNSKVAWPRTSKLQNQTAFAFTWGKVSLYSGGKLDFYEFCCCL